MADPRYEKATFKCVHHGCVALAQHRWSKVLVTFGGPAGSTTVAGWRIAICAACGGQSVWIQSDLAWPKEELVGPSPHADMPLEVLALYEEARLVAGQSHRSAGALLRLALQALVDDLVPGKESLDKKIGILVAKGLHPDVQKAMDVLRVVGNNAVHPGQISLETDDDLIPALFAMLNLVVEQVIERPKQVSMLFDSLPDGAREAILRRDGTPDA